MAFQKRKTALTYRPRDLRDALRACKEVARERRQLSVERIADLMGVTADCLYKWLADARMPAAAIPTYEHICGAHFVTEYLAAGSNRIVIAIPRGVPAGTEDLAILQEALSSTVVSLVRCYRTGDDVTGTIDRLTQALQSLAWHRANVAHLDHPELDLDGDDHA